MAKLLLEKPDVLLLDEPTNFLDKDHVFSLKDSFTKYTSKATTIGRAQGLMQKHFETLRPLLFYPKNTSGLLSIAPLCRAYSNVDILSRACCYGCL